MRIGIDARMLGQGFGLARYVQQLVMHLHEIDQDNEYVLFLRDENWDEFVPTNPTWTRVKANIQWYSLAEQIRFPSIIKNEKVELMHFPHWNVPLLYGGDFVLTIHDLIMYHYPRPEATTLGPLLYWVKDRVHRLVLGSAAKRANKIFVTSHFTKQDVHKTLGVKNEKMVVTYQAPFERKILDTGKWGRVQQQYGIKKPYVLYVGSAYPHKNLEGLLDAWKMFKEADEQDHQLVLVGKESPFYKRLFEEEQKTENKKATTHSDHGATESYSNINHTGFVFDDDLSLLYEEAALYVFPSLYEGFGLPPLEAMSHGVPVVSSNRSCLPEVLGNAPLYVDPENPAQFAEAIERGLSDENIRHDLGLASRELLQRYSWKRLAQQTLQSYTQKKA